MRRFIFSYVVIAALCVMAWPVIATTKTPVIIYSKEIKQVSSADRTWPTIQIWKKVGTQASTLLLTTGKVNEYPTEVKLSPNHKLIAINYEQKIRIFDVVTKKLTDLATAKYWFQNIDWSADSTKLVTMDSKAVEAKTPYQLRVLRVADGQNTIVRSGLVTDFYRGAPAYYTAYWKSATKILVAGSFGEVGAGYWYVNTLAKSVTAAPTYANTKTWTAVQSGTLSSFCNAFAGVATSAYNILNSNTGQRVGTIESKTRAVGIRAISPDGHQVLFYTSHLYTSAELGGDINKCPMYDTRTYFLISFPGGTSTRVTNPSAVLAGWNAADTGADARYNSAGKVSIVRGAVTLVPYTKALQIAAQYWR